ncbi:MAG: hypothetical protein A2V98_01010 [Planctomycetes bacterium RBG_16_64_12]|nr:MAG: hypothetical protein A2V98_01010 [Planctomycetes bacterium RBG_16_64_12]
MKKIMARWEDVKLRSFKEVRKVYIELMDMRYYILAYRNQESTIADKGQEEWEKTEKTLSKIEEKHDRDYLQLLARSPQALEEITLRLETMMWMMGGNLELELNPPGEASSEGPWIPKVSYGFLNTTGILARFLPRR